MENELLERKLEAIAKRSGVPEDVRNEITGLAAEIATPLQTDVWIYRLIVTFLGVAILATVLGGLWIALAARQNAVITVPDGIVAIGSAAVGALAGLLAPSPRTS